MEKNAVVCSQRAMLYPVECDSSLQIVKAVWHASNLKKGTKRPLLSAEGCHFLTDHSAELFTEGRRALKAVKTI
jgi:hypothetical protein